MTFWSARGDGLEPLRKFSFEVSIGDEFKILVKSVNKPTLETDVNEYKLLNQIKKFPTIPKWNNITIKYVDVGNNLTKKLIELMKNKNQAHDKVKAIEKGEVPLVITGYKADGKESSKWEFTNAFIKSINFGDYDYSSDEFVEVEVEIAYDWATLS